MKRKMFKKGILSKNDHFRPEIYNYQIDSGVFYDENYRFFVTKIIEIVLFCCKNGRLWFEIGHFWAENDIFGLLFEWWRNWHKISDPTVTQRDKSQREMMLISNQSYPKMTKNDSKTQNSNQSLDKIEFIFKALKIHSQIERVSC